MLRRSFLGFFLLVPLRAAIGQTNQAAAASAPAITVYKSESCGCCGAWVTYLRNHGFKVDDRNVRDVTAWREKLGVPATLGSWHTAVIGEYAVEGRVPAADIRRLLVQRPKARGIAVPAMPVGSPGMPGPRKDPFDTLLFQADGTYVVFARH